MRHFISLTLVIIVLAVVAPRGEATQPSRDGDARFGITLGVRGEPQVNKEFQVLVLTGSNQHRPDAVGSVSIDVPPGLEVIRGDLKRKVHVSPGWTGPGDNEWKLTLRATRPGQFVIRGNIKIPRGGSSFDEMSSRLRMDFAARPVSFDRWSRATRYERLEGTRRFRYGGEHMVLIDAPEDDIQDRLADVKPPEIISEPSVVCDECKLNEPRFVDLVVTVGRDGSVQWVEPRSAGKTDASVTSAARNAVRGFSYRPASLDGKPIASWTVARVEVRPKK